MEYSTQTPYCLFSFDNKELSFLIHNKQKLHPNDYAHLLYSNIIETLLMLNERITLAFIDSIDNEDDFEAVSGHFPRLSGSFQSKDFIAKIEAASLKFKESKYYEYITDNITDARKALDEDTESLSG